MDTAQLLIINTRRALANRHSKAIYHIGKIPTPEIPDSLPLILDWYRDTETSIQEQYPAFYELSSLAQYTHEQGKILFIHYKNVHRAPKSHLTDFIHQYQHCCRVPLYPVLLASGTRKGYNKIATATGYADRIFDIVPETQS